MWRNVFAGLCIFWVSVFMVGAEESSYRDLYSDTWVATDALGRTMPTHEEVGPVKTDHERMVSIFYITWHVEKRHEPTAEGYGADVTRILAEAPEARLDAKHPLWRYPSYHWGEPEMGYFLSQDEWVIRRDMSMLADAGVDVLVMDVTNAVRYWDEWEVIFPIMQQMKAEGNKVPQFCFWAFNGPVITVVQSLYDRIYKENKYEDLWFHWDGKPLLLYNGTPDRNANETGAKHPNPYYDAAATTDTTHPNYGDPRYTEPFFDDYTDEVKDFFTLRTMWWGYHKWGGERFVGTEGNWSFGYDLNDPNVRNMPPEELIAPWNGEPEQAAVTPAQHPTSIVGKSWSRETLEPELNKYDLPVPTYVPWLDKTVENPEGYGIYFQERWEEALAVGPRMIYINDWNEWTAGKYHPAEGQTYPFLGRQSDYFFVDQYNSEFNRCVHPMKDGFTDNYYMQMAQNIRRYKGSRPIPRLSGFDEITVDGEFGDWDAVDVEYRDTIGDTVHRDHPGYGGLHYTDTTGRNDIVTAKVAVDARQVYFYVETRENFSPYTDQNWMLLLIDADNESKTGWYGYDYLINRDIPSASETKMLRWETDGESGKWVPHTSLAFACAEKMMEIAVPRRFLNVEEDAFVFDFHWADNPPDLETPISLCTHGDSAPNRRFNYRCIWDNETGEE